MSCTSLLFLAALLGVLACNASMVSLRLTFTNSDCTGDITSSLLETLPRKRLFSLPPCSQVKQQLVRPARP